MCGSRSAPAKGADRSSRRSPKWFDQMSVVSPAVLLRGRAQPLRTTLASPGAILALGAAAVAVSAIAVFVTPPAVAGPLDLAQQSVAALAAIAALLLASRSGSQDRRFVARGLVVSLTCVGVGIVAWDLQPGAITPSTGPEDALFMAGVVVLIGTLVRSLFRGLDRARRAEMALDSAILLVATVTVLGTIWSTVLDPFGRDEQAATALIGSLLVSAGPAAAALALLYRGLKPGLRGPYVMLAGVTLVGLAWITWLTMLANETSAVVVPTDYAYSAGILVCAYGAATWSLATAPTPRFARLAQASVDVFPLLAVAVCVALDLLVTRTVSLDIVKIGTAGVVVLTLLRQMLLIGAERRARLAERKASARLESEIRTRAAVLQSLSRLERAATPEETARRVCEDALRLEGIESALVLAIYPNGESSIIGFAGLGGLDELLANRLSPEYTEPLLRNAAAGPWSVTLQPAADPIVGRLHDAGLSIAANAPLLWNDGVIGIIGLSTVQEPAAALVAERLATAREFGVVAGALLGQPLAERARLETLQRVVAQAIEEAAFHPVFQPIVDLTTGQTVGYEALTRFDDGKPPDVWFADAAAVQLELELEMACLRAANRDAASLPRGACLSVNASPGLSAAFPRLLALVESAGREVIMEVTEHAPVESYVGLSAALENVRGNVLIAVDDAGAGYAGLQHILEIKPDIVKLDIALVRSVDRDPARRALIASMVAFARETGCTVLAEGIETEEEMEVCQGLGVTLGQGYLFARPAPIATILETQTESSLRIADCLAAGSFRAAPPAMPPLT
jgi:EAL domain-containing protein (putative c-di-GMP-specific phosphodiesterase class I)